MISKKVTVQNNAGIHCRPSGRIMQKVLEYPDCSFRIETSKGDADLSSILGLMSLGLECGDEVDVIVEGVNENTACKELCELFSFKFDFAPIADSV